MDSYIHFGVSIIYFCVVKALLFRLWSSKARELAHEGRNKQLAVHSLMVACSILMMEVTVVDMLFGKSGKSEGFQTIATLDFLIPLTMIILLLWSCEVSISISINILGADNFHPDQYWYETFDMIYQYIIDAWETQVQKIQSLLQKLHNFAESHEGTKIVL